MSFGGGVTKSDAKSSASSYYDPTQTGIVNNYAQGVVRAANDPNSALSYKAYNGPGLSFGGGQTLADAGRYQAPNASATGYTAANVDPANVRNVTAGQIATTDLKPYENPFTGDVINTTLAQMARQKNIDDTGLAGAATAAHAFGGSRSAVLQNLNDESYMRASGQTVAGLNQANFAQAQGAAGQDIGAKLQADAANQGKDLSVAQGNQAATNQGLQFGAQAQNTASLADQQAAAQAAQIRLQAAGMSADQAQALYGADWQQYLASMTIPQALQALQTQAMGLVPANPLQKSDSTSNSFGVNLSYGMK